MNSPASVSLGVLEIRKAAKRQGYCLARHSLPVQNRLLRWSSVSVRVRTCWKFQAARNLSSLFRSYRTSLLTFNSKCAFAIELASLEAKQALRDHLLDHLHVVLDETNIDNINAPVLWYNHARLCWDARCVRTHLKLMLTVRC